MSLNNFVVIGTSTITGTPDRQTSTAYLMPASNFKNWQTDNRSIITIAGNTNTISVANFSNAIGTGTNGLWNIAKTRYYPISTTLTIGTTLRDLGADQFIGVPGQANMIRLRLVAKPGSVPSSGYGGQQGYVVIGANADICNGVTYPNVSVARV